MEFKSAYLQNVYATVEKKDPHQPEFLQAVGEVLESLQPVVEKRPELEKAASFSASWSRSVWSSSECPGWTTRAPSGKPRLPRPVQFRHRPL